MFATRKIVIALAAITLSLAAAPAAMAQSHKPPQITIKSWNDDAARVPDVYVPWNTSHQRETDCDLSIPDVHVPMGSENQLGTDCSPLRKHGQLRLQRQRDWCNCLLWRYPRGV